MKILNTIKIPILAFCILGSLQVLADTDNNVDNAVSHLQQRWAEVNYQLKSEVQLVAFEQLIEEVKGMIEAEKGSAELWIWSGIIKSTYAGAKGGLKALSFAKQARTDLEKAMEIDANALEGSAYTSLGTLYFNVPGWPIGFGSDKKAESLLLQALEINPDGIDSNYFYGSYLLSKKRYEDALIYLQKAQRAAPRQTRPEADAGRQEEIIQALLEIELYANLIS